MANSGYVSINKAVEALKVTKGTLHYYIRRLKLETHKFELDKNAYLTVEDFERIKALKEAAAQRGEAE